MNFCTRQFCIYRESGVMDPSPSKHSPINIINGKKVSGLKYKDVTHRHQGHNCARSRRLTARAGMTVNKRSTPSAPTLCTSRDWIRVVSVEWSCSAAHHPSSHDVTTTPIDTAVVVDRRSAFRVNRWSGRTLWDVVVLLQASFVVRVDV